MTQPILFLENSFKKGQMATMLSECYYQTKTNIRLLFSLQLFRRQKKVLVKKIRICWNHQVNPGVLKLFWLATPEFV
jgi:hypothetical protein